MQVETIALQLAEQLPYGAVRRGMCPTCNGGDSQESSFCVGREPDRVWWKCFRASCDERGITGGYNLNAPTVEARRQLDKINVYTGGFNTPNEADKDYFLERFEVSTEHVFVSDYDEYILPVRSPGGTLRGVVQRQPVWKGSPRPPRHGREVFYGPLRGQQKPMPKTILFQHTTQVPLAWYRPLTDVAVHVLSDHVVLVEDQISAMKVATAGVVAVALLGNGITVEGVRDVVRQKPRVVTIALDPGAEGAAQALARKWGLYFERTRVVALEADPKDLPLHDLLEELGV